MQCGSHERHSLTEHEEVFYTERVRGVFYTERVRGGVLHREGERGVPHRESERGCSIQREWLGASHAVHTTRMSDKLLSASALTVSDYNSNTKS